MSCKHYLEDEMAERMIVSTRKGVFDFRRRSSGEWSVERASFVGTPVVGTFYDPRSGNLFACLDHGHYGAKLHRSADDGKAWEELPTPSYEGASGEASLNLLWVIAPAGSDQPGVLWAGTVPGGLFKSTDNGESWTLSKALWEAPEKKNWFGGGFDDPGIHTICVDPRDSNHVLVGLSVGGVWATKDGGVTWSLAANGMWAEYVPPENRNDQEIQDPHMILQCENHPDVFWCQHHNGMFRTDDNCANWQELLEVPISNFGFPVAVHPNDPLTAWFAPALDDELRYPVDGKVVVNRTCDGGKSFETLRNGLPQAHAYDLIYRHSLVVDETGERLAMGSTTGALWVSENGGDEWTTVSAHLPPIYAVQFI
jgi:hypothetical protein